MPVSKTSASGREIATVKTDVAALGHMLAKVEAAISKISETHTEMGKILAVHEERLDTQEKERMQRRKEKGLIFARFAFFAVKNADSIVLYTQPGKIS